MYALNSILRVQGTIIEFSREIRESQMGNYESKYILRSHIELLNDINV